MIELLATLAILAILLGAAFPSFRFALSSRRARGAADRLLADVQMARVESVKRQTSVLIVFSDAGWCYGISTGSACSCDSNPGSCNLGSVSSSDFPGIVMAENFADDTLVFNPVRRTSNSGTATFGSPGGRPYSVEVNGLGKARVCQPGAPSGSLLSC